MTQESIQPILDWISAHPTWSGFVVFLISLSESLAIVGLVVPGVVMMTAIGGMMGAGVLPFFQTLLWAILGAVAGDGISYWLGYHYHQHLRDFWPFRQFPKLLARGEAFFKQHGGKSIVFGRFVGPVRPMIPVIAGMMDMPPNRFLFFNILSAIAWAPLYSLPGILIGASLGTLSSEVASRTGLLVLLLLFIIWVIYEILLLIGSWIVKATEKLINFGWKRVQHLAWLRSLLKTAQGTTRQQFGILLLFLLATLSFGITTYDVLHSEGIAEWNEPVYQVLRALYSDKVIAIFAFLTDIGEPKILLTTATVIGLWLFWQKQTTEALCWLIIIWGGDLLGYFIKIQTAIPRPEGLAYITDQFAFPSSHTLLTTIIFGLASVFIQRDLAPANRWIPWAISIPIIFTVAISRVYLGKHWFTDIIGSICLGIALVTLGALLYRRIISKATPIRFILVPGLLAISVTLSIYTVLYYPKARTELIRAWPVYKLDEKNWWKGSSSNYELYRTGAFKRQATVFDVQWLSTLNTIKSTLEKTGWKTVPKLDIKTGVMLLANNPPPTLFPVMPKFHRDRLPILTMAKAIDDHKRVVLQLWQSDYSTQTGIPLWVGTLRLEQANHPLPLVTLYTEHANNKYPAKEFTEELSKNSQIQFRIITLKNEKAHKIILIKNI